MLKVYDLFNMTPIEAPVVIESSMNGFVAGQVYQNGGQVIAKKSAAGYITLDRTRWKLDPHIALFAGTSITDIESCILHGIITIDDLNQD